MTSCFLIYLKTYKPMKAIAFHKSEKNPRISDIMRRSGVFHPSTSRFLILLESIGAIVRRKKGKRVEIYRKPLFFKLWRHYDSIYQKVKISMVNQNV